MDTNKKIVLFQITLPGEALGKIIMMQGKPNYHVIKLEDSSFAGFQGGYCIQESHQECMLYTTSQGDIYVPGNFAGTLRGQYNFLSATNTIQYTIQDQQGNSVAAISLKTKALSK
jgi:hypothetical protein